MSKEANASNLGGSRRRTRAEDGPGRGTRPLRAALLEEADEREVAERRHGAALDQANAVRPFRPLGVPFERELGAPAEPARRGRKPVFERTPHTGLGADAADQNDLAARLQDPRELIERRFRIRRG